MKKKTQISRNNKPKNITFSPNKVKYQIIISTSDNSQSAVLNFFQEMNFVVLKHLAETLFSTYPNATKVMLLDDGWNMFQQVIADFAVSYVGTE